MVGLFSLRHARCPLIVTRLVSSISDMLGDPPCDMLGSLFFDMVGVLSLPDMVGVFSGMLGSLIVTRLTRSVCFLSSTPVGVFSIRHPRCPRSLFSCRHGQCILSPTCSVTGVVSL